MVDPISLHKPIDILEPRAWEVALQQLRALMRNVVTNHDRIRERILELKDRYYAGQMGDGGTNWERWAVGHFAYSPSYLRYLSAPHPLQIDRWEAKRLRAAKHAEKIARAEDRLRSQTAWDQWLEEQKTEREESLKKEAKRLIKTKKQREAREAAKKEAVSHNAAVIDRLVADYRALPKPDQKIFLGLIGVQPIRIR